MCGVLTCLQDDEGKIVAPMAFIPAAERYGLMPSIDRWVISKALQIHAGFARHHELPARFSINLSGASMADASLVVFVRNGTTHRTGARAGRAIAGHGLTREGYIRRS